LVVASDHAGLRELTVRCFHDESLRVYSSADPVGVEVGGAVKNVLAIATGILDGLAERAGSSEGAPGLNARAALITRGLAEMSRLGVALGARPETFMGLSGLGDLVLTATGALSRNRQVGLKLAQGLGLPEALASLGHVAEGVYTAATVHQRALALGVDMPITHAVVDVLEARLTPQQAIHRLMGREARPEL
jgi:glycerol-3-phosphate dehydrogenase (NAD(P)+)